MGISINNLENLIIFGRFINLMFPEFIPSYIISVPPKTITFVLIFATLPRLIVT